MICIYQSLIVQLTGIGLFFNVVLASWMRLKYPHIAIGAVAASAPILQFEDIVPSDTFYKIVSADFKVIIFLLSFASFKLHCKRPSWKYFLWAG